MGLVQRKKHKYLLVGLAEVVVVVVLLLVIELYMGRKNRRIRKPQRAKRQDSNNLKSRFEQEARERHPSNYKRQEQLYRQLAVKTYEVWDD